MNEAVIGLSRVLIEVACQSIYDRLPKDVKEKARNIDGEIRNREMIRQVCYHRLKSIRKNHREIQSVKDKALDLHKEASEILHGKLPNPKTDEETLEFIRDVFSVIEALY